MSKAAREHRDDELSESWHRHHLECMKDMLAPEHRNLRPEQLVEITTKYVEYLNAIAREDDGYLRLAEGRQSWPGMMGKAPEHDDAQTRKFVRAHLGEPRVTPASKNIKIAEWAQAPGTEIIELISKGGPIEKGDPCGIIWAAMSFVAEDVAADGSTIRYCSVSPSPLARPMRPATMGPCIAEKGQQIWVRRHDLQLISDVVTCLYGPAKYSIPVYARRMMDFTLELAPELESEQGQLRDQISAELKQAGTSPTKGLRIPSLSKPLREALNAVLEYTPLNEASTEVKGDPREKSKGPHYDFPSLGLKNKRWNEDVRIPLVKAVLGITPARCSLPSDVTGWVNMADLTVKDMDTPGSEVPRRGRPKKS